VQLFSTSLVMHMKLPKCSI